MSAIIIYVKRAALDGRITPENLEPNPKNPIIAAFFRNIGLADELGSGVRNLYKYGRLYSGKTPELIDGDVFRIIVPLDDSYSFDAGTDKAQINRDDFGKDFGKDVGKDVGINETQQRIIALIAENAETTTENIAKTIGITRRQVETNIRELKTLGIVDREGGRRFGRWTIKRNNR